MTLYSINPIQKPEEYLDKAFRRAKNRAAQIRGKSKTKHQENVKSQKVIELERINIVRTILVNELDAVIKSFPDMVDITPFYNELCQCFLDIGYVKQSLGAVNWAKHKINDFGRDYTKKVKASEKFSNIINARKEFYGRAASAIKQIKKNLEELERARKVLRDFPVLKDIPTVCIAGFPNVGKSTLLSRLTTAKPEIKNYAFTTKQINMGIAKFHAKDNSVVKVQFVDTPGTLNRFDKMNNIEKQSHIAQKHCDLIIYVFDPTLQYPLDAQEKLFEKSKKHGKKMLVYLSKTDLPVDPALVKKIVNKHGAVSDIGELNDKVKNALL